MLFLYTVYNVGNKLDFILSHFEQSITNKGSRTLLFDVIIVNSPNVKKSHTDFHRTKEGFNAIREVFSSMFC